MYNNNAYNRKVNAVIASTLSNCATQANTNKKNAISDKIALKVNIAPLLKVVLLELIKLLQALWKSLDKYASIIIPT